MLPHPGTISSLSLHSDVYVAGQVQLTQIGLDLINWGEMLADTKTAILADPRRTAMFRDKEITVKAMFVELNTKLDNWSKLWVYAGSSSPSDVVLHPDLNAQAHLTLCILVRQRE